MKAQEETAAPMMEHAQSVPITTDDKNVLPPAHNREATNRSPQERFVLRPVQR
jgi:hypothetical protein